MATGTQGTTARKIALQVVEYIAIDVNYNDTGIATGVATGKYLPAGAILIGTDVSINTAFNAVTTNVLTCGTNGPTTNDNIVAAADVAETPAALTQNIKPTGTALGKLAADAQIYVKYTQSGGAATAGAATIIIKYAAQLS